MVSICMCSIGKVDSVGLYVQARSWLPQR